MNKIKPLGAHLQPSIRVAFVLLAVLALFRLLSLPFPDLMDTTEGRYASVAKLMLDRNDWVTPWINFHGVEKPYLGKPPLHFWLIDISYLIFGQNNFSARLPSLLSGIGVALSVWIAASIVLSIEAASVSVAVLGSSCLFFFLSGAVVLDVTLTLGIAIALASFLLADRSRIAGYLFFAGLAFGVLVKGPLACVLAGFTIAPWAIAHRLTLKTWPRQLTCLPWIGGPLLFLALIIPWYWMAEIRNPGFLEYFLWNENFGRYLKKDYGDEYGTGHRQPFGTAWAMMIPSLFPWSVILPFILILARKKLSWRGAFRALREDFLMLYALLWSICCPVLLMKAKQYTGTYLAPSLPGFALLIGVLWQRQKQKQWLKDEVITFALQTSAIILSSLLIVGPIIAFYFFGGGIEISAVASVLGLFVFMRSFRDTWHRDSFTSSLWTSALTALVFVSATICFNNYLSDNRSSRRVLQLAETFGTPGSKLRIGFPFYYPFSSTFYGPQLTPNTIEAIPLKDEEVAAATTDLIIIRKRNLERFHELDPNKELLATLGQWRIFRGAPKQ